MISATHCTFAPSRVIRLAMIRPISPDPRITTFLPGIKPSRFTSFCAVPAEYTPAGRDPGMLRAPLGLSLQPMARITAFGLIWNIPFSSFISVSVLSLLKSITIVSKSTSISRSATMSSYLPAYSGPVSSSLNL